MVTLTTAKIVGSAAELSWSQAQTVMLSNRAQLLIVLKLTYTGEAGLVDLTTIGAEILVELEARASEVVDLTQFSAMVRGVVVGVATEITVDLIVGHVQEETLWLYGQGSVVAYLLRGGRLAALQPSWEQGASVSGLLKSDDVLLLATEQLVQGVGVAQIKVVLSSEMPAESLAPLVHAQPETSEMAAVVGQVGGESRVIGNTWWQKLRPRESAIKLRVQEPRKINLWIGGVIFLVLILMIGIGVVRRSRVMAEADYVNLETSVNQKMAETLSIGDLNPERARSLLTAARGEIEAYLATNPRENYKTKARDLFVTIEESEEKAFKQNAVELLTIVELPILAEGLQATKMRSDGKGNLLFMDTKDSRIVSMHVVDRSRLIIPTESSGTLLDIGAGETAIYGLSSGGVDQIITKQPLVKRVITPDEFWLKPAYLGVFAENIYVLDREQGEIWKYPTLGGGEYGSRRRWFAAGIQPDLANVVDMKVSGDVWLLTSTGKLERYSRGAPVTFSMEGFPAKETAKKLSDPVAVFVTESRVYVLERGAGRIAVFGDDGKYSSQYVNPVFEQASDLVIVDDTAYVLVDNTVKAFGL